MSGWRRCSVFLLTSTVGSSRHVRIRSSRPTRARGMDQDRDNATIGGDRLEEGVVHGVSGLVGTPKWGRDGGGRMAGWAGDWSDGVRRPAASLMHIPDTGNRDRYRR